MLETASSISTEKKTEEPGKEDSTLKNRGKLILDATCAPGDISYPTDLELLNHARKQTEKIIDLLYEQVKLQVDKKPRTMLVKKKRNKIWNPLGFVIVLRENLGKVKEDLAWVESWLNYLILLKLQLLLLF